MRNIIIGFLILILSRFCVQCTSNTSTDISKDPFILHLDTACAKAFKDMERLVAQTKKEKQSPTTTVALYVNMTHQLAHLSQAMKEVTPPEEDAALLNQFFQEDRTMRELLIELEETAGALEKVWSKSQTSPEQAALLKEKFDEISAEENRLKNSVSAQASRRNSVAIRYGFEACASIDPSVGWAKNDS